MRIKKILTIEKYNPEKKAIDTTRHMTGNERVSLLEDLRREITKVTGHEYPSRLRRILEIVKP